MKTNFKYLGIALLLALSTFGQVDTSSIQLFETLDEVEIERDPGVRLSKKSRRSSLRGGIVDIFSFSKDHPYRVEFFDDEVESIRFFDIESQRTIGKASKMSIHLKLLFALVR